jgi:hypothetical protein
MQKILGPKFLSPSVHPFARSARMPPENNEDSFTKHFAKFKAGIATLALGWHSLAASAIPATK